MQHTPYSLSLLHFSAWYLLSSNSLHILAEPLFEIHFWLCWVSADARAFALVAASQAHSGCAVQASPCKRFSCCRAQALRCVASAVSPGLWNAGSVVAHGLSCSVASVISPDQGSNPCLLHWQVDSYPLSYQGNSIISFQNLQAEFWGQSGGKTEQG